MIARHSRAREKRRFLYGWERTAAEFDRAFHGFGRLAVIVLTAGVSAACGASAGPTPSPSAATVSATPSAPAVPTPPGGPAPPQLIGSWDSGSGTPDAPVVLTLTATDYTIHSKTGVGSGKIVVNGSEIDFFNSARCLPLVLPDNVGRYQWTLKGASLHFAPLNTDPCGRIGYLTNQTYTKRIG